MPKREKASPFFSKNIGTLEFICTYFGRLYKFLIIKCCEAYKRLGPEGLLIGQHNCIIIILVVKPEYGAIFMVFLSDFLYILNKNLSAKLPGTDDKQCSLLNWWMECNQTCGYTFMMSLQDDEFLVVMTPFSRSLKDFNCC